jgi:cobyrinic acid a,c-diamide synthase
MSKAFLIAAPWSNSGKTTLTLGMSRWFSNQGNTVQTFKCGPDYIDTIHHSTAARKPAINLDTIMMPEEHVKTVFEWYSTSADISIVEGVMGLFDGAVKDKSVKKGFKEENLKKTKYNFNNEDVKTKWLPKLREALKTKFTTKIL